jgi:PB1 domain
VKGYTVFSIPVGIVYRPNEAKVKNLKAKDYLGKARLVAASDRANAFTGFTGAEIKKITTTSGAKDDRPEEKLSYAATNLVKPNLQSRVRQQSEPPINRNMFPPTPPPESENRPSGKRGSGENNGASGMTRAQSVRGGGPKPQPLDLGRAAFDQSEKPRIGTQRSLSERPRPSRQESIFSRTREPPSRRDREWETQRRRPASDEDEEADDYPDELYDMYQTSKPNRSTYNQRSRSAKPQRPMYINEEEEDEFEPQSSVDEAEFEMLSRSKSRRRSPTTRTASRRPDIRTIRVKVHAEDTRYVFIEPNKAFRDFVAQIREKFGLRQNFKIKIKDEEDMITMSDQDDLDMAIQNSRTAARREKAEMGKMEVSFRFFPFPLHSFSHPFSHPRHVVSLTRILETWLTPLLYRFGYKKYRSDSNRDETPLPRDTHSIRQPTPFPHLRNLVALVLDFAFFGVMSL